MPDLRVLAVNVAFFEEAVDDLTHSDRIRASLPHTGPILKQNSA
jgi:hypothetical protein